MTRTEHAAFARGLGFASLANELEAMTDAQYQDQVDAYYDQAMRRLHDPDFRAKRETLATNVYYRGQL